MSAGNIFLNKSEVDRLKILIIRAGALGDTLMLMPLINALSGHQVTIVGRKPGIDYLEPFVEKCLDIERGGWHRLFSMDSDPDISWPEADHVIAFINDKEKIVSQNLGRIFTGSSIDIFSPFPAPDSKTHVVVHMAQALQAAGIPVNPRTVLDAALDKPAMGSNRGAGKKIVLHPGSGSRKKNYSPEFWLGLTTHIKKENPDLSLNIDFLLGPAEEDIALIVKKMTEENNTGIYICPEKEELLSILNDTCLYIGHDSGITHLAAMLGINTIVIFKESTIDQWRPLGPFVWLVEPDENPAVVLRNTAREIGRILCR